MNRPATAPIVHRDVAILSVAEPAVLDELRAVLPIDDYVFAHISDTELVVDPTRLGELASRLARCGWNPLMKRAPRD